MTKSEIKREMKRLEHQIDCISEQLAALAVEQEQKEIRLHELECALEGDEG